MIQMSTSCNVHNINTWRHVTQQPTQGVLGLHQGHRGQAGTHSLGGQDAVWGAAAGAEGLRRLGARRLLLPQRRPAGHGHPQQQRGGGGRSARQRVSTTRGREMER